MIVSKLRRRSTGDDGETLIEILMAIAILGVASVGLIAGLSTNIIASDTHRRLSDVEVVAKSFGEAVKNQLLREPSTTLTAAVAPHSAGDSVDLQVASTAGFGAAPFSVAIDTEVFNVTSVGSGVLHTMAQAASSHANGAVVTRYVSCPVFADAKPTFSTTAFKLQTPTITQIDYYSKTGSLIASQTSNSSTPPSACSNFWKTAPQTCASTSLHVTDCDPALIGVRFSVASTDASTERGASTQTVVLIRRTS